MKLLFGESRQIHKALSGRFSWFLLVILMAIPAIVIWAASSQGIGLSQDSTSYLAAAKAFGSGQGLLGFDGRPLTLFPPGISIIYGTFDSLGVDVLHAAVWLNIASMALTVLGTFMLARVCLRSNAWALSSAAVVSTATSLIAVYVWLWTEPVFTLAVLMILVLLSRAFQDSHISLGFTVAIGLLVSFAISLRYVGVLLIPVVALGLWWSTRDLARPKAAGRIITGLLLACAAPFAIIVRNLANGSGPFGDRYPGVRTVPSALVDSIEILGDLLLPPGSIPGASVLGVIICLLALAGGWRGFVTREKSLVFLAFFVALFLGVNVWSQSTTRLDSPSIRLLAPAIPALVILATSGFRLLSTRLVEDCGTWVATSSHQFVRARGGRVLQAGMWAILISCMALFLLLAIRADARLIAQTRAGEAGLSSPALDSELVAAARRLSGGLASNDPWLLYVGLRRSPVLPLPPSSLEWPRDRVDRDVDALIAGVRSGDIAYALVFEAGAKIEDWEFLERAGVVSSLVERTNDGAIYELSLREKS